MHVYFRVFALGLLLLCACTGGFFTKQNQKPAPYYFSYKKNAAAKPQASQPEAAAAVVFGPTQIPARVSGTNEADIKAPPAVSASPKPNLLNTKETGISDRFAKVNQAKETTPDQKPTPLNQTETKAKPNAETQNLALLAAAGLFFAVAAGLFRLFTPQAKNIAHWAKENRKTSWALIGVIHTVLGFQAAYLGRLLHELGFQTTEMGTHLLLAAIAVAVLAYPTKKPETEAQKNLYFRKSRLLMLALLVGTFFGFVSLGNRNAADKSVSPLSTKIEQVTHLDDKLITNAASHIAPLISPEAPAKPADFEAGVLIFLTIIGALVLLQVLAYISCALLCGGLGGLALLVLLGGTALLIWGVVAVIREILDGARQRKGYSERFGKDPALPKPAPEPPRDPNAPRPRKQKIDWF